jgi:hypothetical protein
MRLAAVLWRFLLAHEPHVAAASGIDAFDVVGVVPSKTSERDEARPGLRTIAGTIVQHTAPRFEQLLQPTNAGIPGRYFDPGRYAAVRRLNGQSLLLIDDTWVTGSSAQSAAAALREAGAVHVACVVIGRWLRPDYGGAGARSATSTTACPGSSTGRAAPPRTRRRTSSDAPAGPARVVIGHSREARARHGSSRQALPYGSPPASPDGPRH